MRMFRRNGLGVLLVVVIGSLLSSTASGDAIFVAVPGALTVGEYTTSGATVNASLISVNNPLGVAVSGTNLFVTNGNTVGEYTTSGAMVNASLISAPIGQVLDSVVVSGSDLFVTSEQGGTVGEYTTSGAAVNPSLISGLNVPGGIAVSGSDLFVMNDASGVIGEYTTSGATVNASLISLPITATYFAVSGGDLFAVSGSGTVGEYNATTGTPINASLISGLNAPIAVAIDGSDLFVLTNGGNGTIGEYTTSGATVNASLISGLDFARSLTIAPAVAPVPEPSTLPLLGLCLTGLGLGRGIVRLRTQRAIRWFVLADCRSRHAEHHDQ